MHSLPNPIVAAEGEGEVGYSSRCLTSRQVLLNPGYSLYEIYRIILVLLYTCCNREHIYIKNYVVWSKAALLCENLIGAAAYLYLSLKCNRLPLLVEGHNNYRRPKVANLVGLLNKDLLTLFKAYGINYCLASALLKSHKHRLPVRRIYHKWDLSHLRVVQKPS